MAFVISAMCGGGIYDLPQNMAINAGLIAQIIAWGLAGFIIWYIVQTFMVLSEVRPQYTNGLYQYAEAGFGKFTAFIVSWGYWVCQSFEVAGYSVLLMATLNFFWPGTFTNGNTWFAVLGGSIVLWIISIVLLQGLKSSSRLSIGGVIVLILSISFFIVTLLVFMNWKTFTTNPWANESIKSLHDIPKGNIATQVKAAMLTTLFEFVGIETGVVLSGHAQSQADVRKATKYGFVICLIMFTLTAILPLGIYSYGQLGALASPSTSLIMQHLLGPIGRLILTFSAIVGILASWVSWMVVLMEMPQKAAEQGTFPSIFKKVNQHKVPVISLIATVGLVEVIIISMHFVKAPFIFCLSMVGMLIIAPYFVSALFLLKISWNEKSFNPDQHQLSFSRKQALLISIVALLGVVVIAYSAGTKYLFYAVICYLIGIPVFVYARFQNDKKHHWFTKREKLFVLIILLIGLGSCVFI